MCRVGRRCFPHTADRLDRAEQEVRRLQLTHDARLATAARQPTSQSWLDPSAGELDQARRKLQQQRINLASTARGAHNLMLEAHAHEQCGQPQRAAELRRPGPGLVAPCRCSRADRPVGPCAPSSVNRSMTKSSGRKASMPNYS